MNKLIITLALFFEVTNISAESTKKLTLIEAHEIKAALEIHLYLIKIGKNISTCYDAGNKHLICFCENKKPIRTFNKLLNNTLKQYPRWLKYKSLTFNKPNGVSVTIFPTSLKKQNSMVDQCD